MHRTANLLGATALAVNDVALAGAARQMGVSSSTAAALMVLSAASSPVGISELGRRVGLSQSAAVRMVDALERERLITRRKERGRGVSVLLTGIGDRTVQALSAARGTPLTEIVGVLDEQEQAALAGLLGKLLARLYERVGSAELICRLCDRASCVQEAVCPVGQAERDRGGGRG